MLVNFTLRKSTISKKKLLTFSLILMLSFSELVAYLLAVTAKMSPLPYLLAPHLIQLV